MINPFDGALRELQHMNAALLDRLDKIIHKLDVLIAIERDEQYGDGR